MLGTRRGVGGSWPNSWTPAWKWGWVRLLLLRINLPLLQACVLENVFSLGSSYAGGSTKLTFYIALGELFSAFLIC